GQQGEGVSPRQAVPILQISGGQTPPRSPSDSLRKTGHSCLKYGGTGGMSAVSPLPALLTEAEAYERYGSVLRDKELRRAREARAIGYYKRKGKILYREDELAAFVLAKLE